MSSAIAEMLRLGASVGRQRTKHTSTPCQKPWRYDWTIVSRNINCGGIPWLTNCATDQPVKAFRESAQDVHSNSQKFGLQYSICNVPTVAFFSLFSEPNNITWMTLWWHPPQRLPQRSLRLARKFYGGTRRGLTKPQQWRWGRRPRQIE